MAILSTDSAGLFLSILAHKLVIKNKLANFDQTVKFK